MVLDDRAVDGDDEEARKFRNGRDDEVLGGVDLVLPGAVLGVEEVAGVEVVASVCSAEPEELHGGVSTTTLPLCLLSAGFREERGTEEGKGRRRRRGRRMGS